MGDVVKCNISGNKQSIPSFVFRHVGGKEVSLSFDPFSYYTLIEVFTGSRRVSFG